MARRKQLKISVSNIALRGWQSKGVKSEFIHLGEKGLGVYFLLLRRMGGENLTWISINTILEQLCLQRRDKQKIVQTLNYLIDLKLIFGDNVQPDVKNGEDLEFYVETDLKFSSYTSFYPNNFNLYKILGSKGFSVYCMIESFVGTNKSAWCSIDTLVELTGFSNNTILECIQVMDELEIYNINYGAYSPQTNKNAHNTYFPNKVGRIKVLGANVEDAQLQVREIKEGYSTRTPIETNTQTTPKKTKPSDPF